MRVTQPVAQGVVDERPRQILAPLAKVPIDGSGAEIFGQQPPRVGRPNHVKAGIDQGVAVLADRNWGNPFGHRQARG
jgi:hypothetical protein